MTRCPVCGAGASLAGAATTAFGSLLQIHPGAAGLAFGLRSVTRMNVTSTPSIGSVLVVDDDPAVAEIVCEHLDGEGYRCLRVADGVEALRAVRDEQPDFLVLDVSLPGLSGLEVCRRLRQDETTAHVPILMLTSKDDEVDRVLGLRIGADDYMTKPFSVHELSARVEAIRRRIGRPAPEHGLIRIGDLELDEARRQVRVAGEPVSLGAKEFILLAALIHADGRVLGRDQLLARVWGTTDLEGIHSRAVDMHMSRVRRKLGAEGRRIVAVKGAGYRFDTA
jgi:DNA-binding response OmpR family regulator